MSLKNQVFTFKWISIFEGVSFLVLLFIAMPLKYIWNSPDMVELFGSIHGFLFIVYILGALVMYKQLQWDLKTLLIVCFCSVLPFGPFYAEKRYL